MKKIVLAFGLVVFMVVGTFGGMVMATDETAPVEDCCPYIVSAVDNISDNMTFVVSAVDNISDNMTFIVAEVDEMSFEVSEVSDNVSYVVSAVDNISDNMTFIVAEVEEMSFEVSEVSDNVSYVVSAVDNISDNMTFIVEEVEDISYEVSETGDNVDYIVSEVSNVVHMEVDSGMIKIKPGTKLDNKPEANFGYSEIRNVVVTLYTNRSLEEGDGIYISATWPGMNDYVVVATLSYNDDQVRTIEFNASKWEIHCESGRPGYDLSYVVTTMYVPLKIR